MFLCFDRILVFQCHKAQIKKAGQRDEEGVFRGYVGGGTRKERHDSGTHDGRGHQTGNLVGLLGHLVHADGEDEREDVCEADADQNETQPCGEGVVRQEQQHIADDGNQDGEHEKHGGFDMAQAYAAEETAHEQGNDEHDVAQCRRDARVVFNQNGGDAVEHGSFGAAVEEDA